MAFGHRPLRTISKRELADHDGRAHSVLLRHDLEKITMIFGAEIGWSEVVDN